MELTATDRKLLAAIQDGLPLVSRPFAELGARIGLAEADVVERLRCLSEDGVVRRLGIIVRHRELGYRANAMTVWDVPAEQVQDAARQLVRLPYVTLCYRRPRRPPDWPYNLFVMIHGRDRDVVHEQIETATREAGLDGRPRAILFSRRRFKQRGARYADKLVGSA